MNMKWNERGFRPPLSPGGLRLSTLPLGHGGCPQYWIFTSSGEKHFVSLKLECQSAVLTRELRLSNQAAYTTAPGPPPYYVNKLSWCLFSTEININDHYTWKWRYYLYFRTHHLIRNDNDYLDILCFSNCQIWNTKKITFSSPCESPCVSATFESGRCNIYIRRDDICIIEAYIQIK